MKKILISLMFLGASATAMAGGDEINTHVRCVSQNAPADGGYYLDVISGGLIGVRRAELSENSIMGQRPLKTFMSVTSTLDPNIPRVSHHEADGLTLLVKQQETVGRASFLAELVAHVDGRSIQETMICYDDALFASSAAIISIYSNGVGGASEPFAQAQGLISEEMTALRLARYTLLGVGIEGGGSVCVEFHTQTQVEEFLDKLTKIRFDENTSLNVKREFICEE